MKIQKFRPPIVSLFLTLCLAPCGASAQTGITGIKIKASGFDPVTRDVKLTFINDTTQDITAWSYCVKAENAPGHIVSHSFCTSVDPLDTVIDEEIELKKRPDATFGDCDRCHLIRPGQELTLLSHFKNYPEVVSAKIEVNLIAYSGGTVQISSADQAQYDLEQLTKNRREELKIRRDAAAMARKILADPGSLHPARDLIQQADRDPRMEGILYFFKRPEWHRSNHREFVPDSEREYLRGFVADQDIWAAELAKNQITGVAQ